MKEHRVRWNLAYISVLAVAIPVLGQAPSRPMTHQPATPRCNGRLRRDQGAVSLG